MEIDKLLTHKEAAEKLGIVPATLSVWRSRDKGPAYFKIGAAVRYRADDIDAWVETRRIDTQK